ncbi:response regulator [Carboxylicivirga caseinilyticus]|uniref:ATP-binding response regulator n=1 Tax=Carboxylicivirga caseinilyticus TaxID=3417572 RepID=UPI003D32FACE|nr:hybrid sensor histidine kinase/response regulator [Marinilabiliaceae bacterium A049]
MKKKGRILIIDDNTKNLQVLANILSSNHYDVEIGISGFDVFNWLEHEIFDLLLLDIMMPEIDGFEVCRRIRKNNQYDLMPIIFISAKTDSQSMVEGFDSGGQDYISKPFDQAELLARVKTHIELRKSKESLKRLNTDLEQLVNERTYELNIANKKLLDLSKTKDRFLKFIGNEISKPLVSITKVIEIIKHSSESNRMAGTISQLDQSVEKLRKVTLMASYITQISTSAEINDRKPFSLLSAVEYILVKMNSILEQKNLELDIDIDDKIVAYGNNLLFKSSLQSILSTVFEEIEDNQLIKISSIKNKETNQLVIEAFINSWNDNDSLSEEISLLNSYSQTIMQLDAGAFRLLNEDQRTVTFEWTFLNENRKL